MRVRIAAMAAAITACAAGAAAQDRPDLSGRWVLIPDKSASRAAGEADLTISQTATTITFDVPVTRMLLRSDGFSRAEPAGRQVETYTFDAGEVREAQPPAPRRPGAMTLSPVEKISRAAWQGDQLVIVTHTLSRGYLRDGQPQSVRQTVRQAWWLDADGTLTVERVIVADPRPTPTRQDPPAPWRDVYRRLSSGVPGFQGSGVPGFRGSRVPGLLVPGLVVSGLVVSGLVVSGSPAPSIPNA